MSSLVLTYSDSLAGSSKVLASHADVLWASIRHAFLPHKIWGVEGDTGWDPGRTGGERGTGGGRRKGGRRDLYDGVKRERNSKRQAFVICYFLLPVKETNPTTFLDFHLTFSEA